MKETELAEQVIEWLLSQNWNVYQEVEFQHMGGVADIVAERHGILWIIETKMSMTIKVLNQASGWPAHYRSIAVPRALHDEGRDFRVAKDYYGVGVIEVEKNDVYEQLKPPLFLRNHKAAKRMLAQLTELHKTYCKAGSQSGHLTPYKQTMLDIQRTISNHPGCTVDDLFKTHGVMHYASKSSFKGNVLKCLASFERDWCRIDTTTKPYKLYIRQERIA